MLFFPRRNRLLALLCLLLPIGVWAAEPGAMAEDKGHVYRWNKYTDDLYALHLKQIADRKVRTEEKLGGYAGNANFYRQVKFFDADSGLLLSSIQWEVAHPDNIHSIAVFRHDKQGRVVRDYSSTYLPKYRNAPTQTLAFVHHYPKGVHAFRSFDASGDMLDERCEGRFEGESIFITLDIDELDAARGERYQDQSGIMTEPAYLHCFAGLAETVDTLLPPH